MFPTRQGKIVLCSTAKLPPLNERNLRALFKMFNDLPTITLEFLLQLMNLAFLRNSWVPYFKPKSQVITRYRRNLLDVTPLNIVKYLCVVHLKLSSSSGLN